MFLHASGAACSHLDACGCQLFRQPGLKPTPAFAELSHVSDTIVLCVMQSISWTLVAIQPTMTSEAELAMVQVPLAVASMMTMATAPMWQEQPLVASMVWQEVRPFMLSRCLVPMDQAHTATSLPA